jgi:hypothetical protein
MTAMSPRAWKLVNVAMFVAVMAANGAAGSGALSGESIGVVANRYVNYFLPANWVFGIWSLIYLLLAVFTVYQALPGARAERVVRALGAWWTVSVALNIGWVTAFAYSRFGLAMVIMLGLLVTLVRIVERLHGARATPSWGEALCARLPFDLYLSWISVAVIANTFQYAHVVGWNGLGISEVTWSVTMMTVATVLGWIVVVRRGVWAFPPTVAWAIYGIGARFPEVPAIAAAAGILVPGGLAGGLVAALYRWRSARRPRA